MRESFRDLDFYFDPSLVLYLPLHKKDGAAVTSDDAYGHACTVVGATWGIQGRTFDGVDDVINCGDNVSLDIISALTVEAWAKFNALDKLYHIAGRDDGTNRNYFLSRDSTNTISFPTFIGGASKVATSSGTYGLGIWYHIVGTYDGSNVSIFVNGALAGTPTAATGDIDNDDVSFTVGLRAVANDRDLNGTVGEVRVYNRALSLIEIQNIYQSTKWRYQ